MKKKTMLRMARGSAVRENYNARIGEGLGAKGFGWSVSFTLAFIMEWNNDNLTWCFSDIEIALSSRELEPRVFSAYDTF